jgi:hypothetical protein
VPIGADFLSGVRTFVKDKVDVARLPTKRGTGAWTRRGLPILTASSLAASGHLDDSGGQSEGVELRIQGLGRMPAIQTGPQSLQNDTQRARRRRAPTPLSPRVQCLSRTQAMAWRDPSFPSCSKLVG